MSDNFSFKVNLGGMIDILSNHLYSSPKIFIRELLQNATDAISARIKENPDWNKGQITVTLEEGKMLRFRDNGIGLTETQIHNFLAVIGQSSKRDMISGKLSEDYIGRFGIGLLSCFMVTDKIIINTRAFNTKENGFQWIGMPDGTYTISPLEEPISAGTEVFIEAKEDSKDYFYSDTIHGLINYYGLPLPFPVILRTQADMVGVNVNQIFRKMGMINKKDVMELGEYIFKENFFDYIPLESPTGLFSGVAYILPYRVNPNIKNSHRIYLKNMLLTEDGTTILPSWAFFVKCFFNTDFLRPTASRENFYEDEDLSNARDEISQCIAKYLVSLSKKDPDMLKTFISIHSLAIKSLAIENDEMFNVFINYISFETSLGDMTGRKLKAYKKPIIYTYEIDKFQQLSAIFLSQRRLLLNTGYVYDNQLIEKLTETYDNLNILILDDTEISEILEDISIDEEEQSLIFQKTANAVLRHFDCKAELKKYKPFQLASFYTINSDAIILRDIKKSVERSEGIFADMLNDFAEEIYNNEMSFSTLYFNLNNSLVKKLFSLKDKEQLEKCIEILYVQALLTGHFPLRHNELDLMNKNIINLLEWRLDNV